MCSVDWKTAVVTLILIVIGLALFAKWRPRDEPQEPKDNLANTLAPLECFQCFFSQNVQRQSHFLNESSCLDKPQTRILCEPGQYCSLRYQEAEEWNVKLIERSCISPAKSLNLGEYSCTNGKHDGVKELMCICNYNLCLSNYVIK